MENQAGWHGAAINDEQFEQAMKELGGGVRMSSTREAYGAALTELAEKYEFFVF